GLVCVLFFLVFFFFFFFFSSRRRHTRWPRDWSSDVCSSDLRHGGVVADERRAVELPRELFAHHDTQRSAQTGHADHPRDWRTLARRDQGQRRSFAVSQQQHLRKS